MIKRYNQFSELRELKESDEDVTRIICNRYNITNCTLNLDGTIDVYGDVDLYYRQLTKLPLKFGKVTGNFNFAYNQLTTLEGCPKSVGGDFNVSNNQLTTLEGCPKSVGDNFYCRDNKLTTFEGICDDIKGALDCRINKIINFYGFPDRLIGIDLYLSENPLGEIYHGIFKGDSRCIDLLNMTRSIYKNEVREMGIEDISDAIKFDLDPNWRDKIKSYTLVT